MNQEVNKIIDELYTCLPNDRNKFNSIMKSLKQKFLTTSSTERISFSQNFPTTSLTSQIMNKDDAQSKSIPNVQYNAKNINMMNNTSDTTSSMNPLKSLGNFQPINLPEYNAQNKQYDGLNNGELGEFIDINAGYQSELFNNNLYENKIKNDIHANCKYYYPNEYNSQFNDNNKMQNYDMTNNQMNSNYLMNKSQNNFYKTQSGI